ncbi:MAG: LemA protein [Candidatus Peregrinibacteria bacterium Gr01-1014_25]|nr:MAG: LemA protein [Candidatus Peregrinibacteria bacterium Gr01-1014_25]
MDFSKIRTVHVIIGIVVLLLLWVGAGYNGLITSREAMDASWAQVETQYQRRADLLPNLINTVKGAARFEQSTLQQVTEARTKWMGAGTRSEKIAAAGGLDSALARLLVTVEAYPQLQSVQAFRDLMTQLEGTENRIGTARRDFNEAVRIYNLRVKRFPGNVLAGFFGFVPEAFFESDDGADTVPTVNFDQ